MSDAVEVGSSCWGWEGQLHEGDGSSALNLQTSPPDPNVAQYLGNCGGSGLCWFGFSCAYQEASLRRIKLLCHLVLQQQFLTVTCVLLQNAFFVKGYYAQTCAELYFCNPVAAAGQKGDTKKEKRPTLRTLVRVGEVLGCRASMLRRSTGFASKGAEAQGEQSFPKARSPGLASYLALLQLSQSLWRAVVKISKCARHVYGMAGAAVAKPLPKLRLSKVQHHRSGVPHQQALSFGRFFPFSSPPKTQVSDQQATRPPLSAIPPC